MADKMPIACYSKGKQSIEYLFTFFPNNLDWEHISVAFLMNDTHEGWENEWILS